MRPRTAKLALWLAWLVPLGVYLLSAYHDVGFWDVGEMDTVPWILGIAHPTGFPAYVMSAWLFTHLVPIGTVAFRMSLISALGMSGAAWFAARIIDEELCAPWIAAACAWLFAFGDVAWTRATRAEVHSIAVLAIAATIYCALRWYRERNDRWFVLGAVAWGFAIGVHPVAALLLPGLFVLLLARLARMRQRVVLGTMAVFAVVVVAIYAYLPLRSAYVTAHNLDPSHAVLGAPPGRPFWDYDHPATRDGLAAEVSGSDFDVSGGLHALLDPTVYITRGPIYIVAVVTEFAWIGALLALAGIYAAWQRDRTRAVALFLFGFMCIPFALGYGSESDYERYFLTSFVVVAVFAGEGAVWLSARLRWRRVPFVGALALASVVLIVMQRHLFAQPWDDRATREIVVYKQATPPNAIIVSNWAFATPLAYAEYVERDFDQRNVDVAWIDDDAGNIRRWLKTRPVFYAGDAPNGSPGFRLVPVGNVWPPLHRVYAQ